MNVVDILSFCFAAYAGLSEAASRKWGMSIAKYDGKGGLHTGGNMKTLIYTALAGASMTAASAADAAATLIFQVTPDTQSSSATFELRVNLTTLKPYPTVAPPSNGYGYASASAFASVAPLTTPNSAMALQAGGFSSYQTSDAFFSVYREYNDGVAGKGGLDFKISANSFVGRDYIDGGPAFLYRSAQLNLNSQAFGSDVLTETLTTEYIAELFARNPIRYSEFGSTLRCESEEDNNCATLSMRSTSGTVVFTRLEVAAVPEPATWAMMLIGFAMIGAAARYQRRGTKIVYA